MNKTTKPNSFPGVFITIEGPDGCGKSTNTPVLQKLFEELDVPVMTTREPGGTTLAENIRNIVLHHDDAAEPLHPRTELMLFGSARAQHLTEKVFPALSEGIVVICDRFALSSRAYQGHGRGLVSAAEKMEEIVHPGFQPDYVLYFSISFELSLERARSRNGVAVTGDRFEDADLELKKRIFNGFVQEMNSLDMRQPGRVITIDATQSLDDIKVQLKIFAEFVAKTIALGYQKPSGQATLEF
jgi:dTMP kinase